MRDKHLSERKKERFKDTLKKAYPKNLSNLKLNHPIAQEELEEKINERKEQNEQKQMAGEDKKVKQARKK